MTRSTITVAGLALTREKSARWNEPWSCTCGAGQALTDTNPEACAAFVAWAQEHAASCSGPAKKARRG